MKRDLSPTQATPAELWETTENKAGAASLDAGFKASDSSGAEELTRPIPTSRRLPNNQSSPSPTRFHDEASALYSLVEDYFDNGGEHCERCVHFHELSETCQALEDGMAELCPMSSELIEDEIRANQEDQAGCYDR